MFTVQLGILFFTLFTVYMYIEKDVNLGMARHDAV
jgi:hypothetical protein